MSEEERATVTTSTSTSQLETVQPFSIEESPRLEVGVESPKVMDSSTLVCTSIGQSPIACEAPLASKPQKVKPSSHYLFQLSQNNRSSDSSGGSIGGGSSDVSDMEDDDFETNQSAKSTASERRSGSSGSSGNISTTDKCNTMDNQNSDAGEEDESSLQQLTDEETPNASDVIDTVDDSDAGRESEPEPDSEAAQDSKAGLGMQSSESSDTGDQSESVFANLAETAEAMSSEPAEKALPQRSSQRVGGKNELANLIEKAILDFCSSRTVETMRRMFGGVTNDTETQQRDGGRHDDKSASTPHPVTGELVKEGVIIGDIDVFAPRMQREYILPVRDSLIASFLKDPGVFRAICYRTRCQVEVTRRILNRKLCIGGRWNKYMIIRITGPTHKTIRNCDILLRKAVPDYKARKEYMTPAVCRMFLREEVPDNAELYYSYQRTGGTSQRFGALKLESPFRTTPNRSIGTCPWKFGLFKPGKLAFSCPSGRLCMKHVYPSLGYQTTSNLEREYQGVHATDRIHLLHEQFHMRRQSALSLKRALTIPVCR